MSKIVERTLDFFEAFANEKRPLSLTELSRLLGVPVSSCHDVVKALERRGYVHEIAPRAGFYPTQRLHEVARTIAEHDSIALHARPVLEAVCASLGETITLSKVMKRTAIYLLVVEPENPVRYSVQPGHEIISVHGTSVGKSMLSLLDESHWNGLLGTGPLKRLTPKTITSRAHLREDVNRGRARGWYLNDEESRPGVVTLSAPFHWNRLAHVFTVAGPSTRMANKFDLVAKTVVSVAKALGEGAQPTGR